MGGGKGGPVWGPLEVRVAPLWRTLARLLVIAVPSMLWALHPHGRFDTYSAEFFGAVYGTLIALAIGQFVVLRGRGCLVRFDDAGVTVHGGRTVTWTELATVERSKKYRGAVVFVPRSGTAPLPLVPMAFGARRDGRRSERLIRRFGSPLVLFTTHLDAGADDVIAAVERFSGGVPVVREPA